MQGGTRWKWKHQGGPNASIFKMIHLPNANIFRKVQNAHWQNAFTSILR